MLLLSSIASAVWRRTNRARRAFLAAQRLVLVDQTAERERITTWMGGRCFDRRCTDLNAVDGFLSGGTGSQQAHLRKVADLDALPRAASAVAQFPTATSVADPEEQSGAGMIGKFAHGKCGQNQCCKLFHSTSLKLGANLGPAP